MLRFSLIWHTATTSRGEIRLVHLLLLHRVHQGVSVQSGGLGNGISTRRSVSTAEVSAMVSPHEGVKCPAWSWQWWRTGLPRAHSPAGVSTPVSPLRPRLSSSGSPPYIQERLDHFLKLTSKAGTPASSGLAFCHLP